MDEQERRALRKALEAGEAQANEAVEALKAAVGDVLHDVWPFEERDFSFTPDELDTILEGAFAYGRAIPRMLAAFVDTREHQEALCATLYPFRPTEFTVASSVGPWSLVPLDGYWAVGCYVEALTAVRDESILCRLAVRLAAERLPSDKTVSREEARAIEQETLTQARARVDELRTMLTYGGQCNNAECRRFGYLGQESASCEDCGQSTTLNDGVTFYPTEIPEAVKP